MRHSFCLRSDSKWYKALLYRMAADNAVAEYIEAGYNRKRPHSMNLNLPQIR